MVKFCISFHSVYHLLRFDHTSEKFVGYFTENTTNVYPEKVEIYIRKQKYADTLYSITDITDTHNICRQDDLKMNTLEIKYWSMWINMPFVAINMVDDYILYSLEVQILNHGSILNFQKILSTTIKV